ncbi:hypothetical protein KJ966_22615 [bacterium]|nr:hypothetical protein [bacterium]
MKKTSFNQEEMEAFKPSEKIGLIACINPDGEVHMTLITSIMASSPNQLTLGQFCTGRGKWFIQTNNKLSFLIMTLDKKLWRGKARWTHKRLDGEEYEIYNEMPMFRYNTYFGINTVHYLDLVETSQAESLPMAKIIPAALATKLAKSSAKTGNRERILKPFAENLFNDLGSLKFLSYLGEDGFPVIIPVIQCQASDSRRLAFSTIAFRDELKDIPVDTRLAVYCLNMKMQSVLVRGKFNGYSRLKGIKTGTLDIDWVYNSMPPIHEQIYPGISLQPVESF